MVDHEMRRKIIREWMALSEGKATDRRTGCGIRQKGGPAKRVSSESTRSEPKISARPVSEINGMAFASRWQIVMGADSRSLLSYVWL
jgi:hypothetical protein